KLFALTTHAAHWFMELGFRPGDVSALPSQRQTMYNWRRGSKVFTKRIWEAVSKEAWAQWLKQQTMLVNENRLNLADAKARKYLMEQTERHFFGEGADTASGYVPPQK